MQTQNPHLPGSQPAVSAPHLLTQNAHRNGIILLAIYHFFVSGLFLLATMILMLPTLILGVVGVAEDAAAFIPAFILVLIAVVLMALALVNLVVGYGLWTQRGWGRLAALVLAFLRLVNVPIGTTIGGLAIWYLLQEDVTEQFQG